MANRYEVVVGNVGTVYDGSSLDATLKVFKEYQDQSKSGVGRAAGEDVTVLKNGTVRWDYDGKSRRLR